MCLRNNTGSKVLALHAVDPRIQAINSGLPEPLRVTPNHRSRNIQRSNKIIKYNVTKALEVSYMSGTGCIMGLHQLTKLPINPFGLICIL